MNDKSKHAKLYVGSMITLRALENYLIDKKIPCLIKNHTESQRLGGFGGSNSANELYVYEEDLKEAQAILTHFLKES